MHSTHQHSQSRGRSSYALQPTSILYIVISLIMDNIQHLLTQQPATTKRKTGNESRTSRGTPTNLSNITTSASKATSWNPFLYRFARHFSREAPAIIFPLHITTLCYIRRSSHGLIYPHGFWLPFVSDTGKASYWVVSFSFSFSILLFHFPIFLIIFFASLLFSVSDWRSTSRDQRCVC